MKFAFIHTQIATSFGWTASALCRILRVSRSGYAVWQRRQQEPPTPVQQAKQQEEARLMLQIQAAYRKGRCYYGRPRVHDELRDRGIRTSRKRVARLMQQAGLVSRRRRRITTTDSRHRQPVAANVLERRFAPSEVARPNRFWCGDITYVPTKEGWLYLATVKDVFSRRVLGWAMHESLGVELVTSAWKRALHTRGFASNQGPQLYHSDRGSQYASHVFQELLFCSGTQASMSRKAECLDNAVAESFFGTLKAELLEDQPRRRFASKAAAIELVSDYIDNFYNIVRRHSALGSKSPIAFELAHRGNKEILLSQ
jgi:transposase InsO family protein